MKPLKDKICDVLPSINYDRVFSDVFKELQLPVTIRVNNWVWNLIYVELASVINPAVAALAEWRRERRQ